MIRVDSWMDEANNEQQQQPRGSVTVRLVGSVTRDASARKTMKRMMPLAWCCALVLTSLSTPCDASNGAPRHYFFNSRTGESQWEDPRAAVMYRDEEGRAYWYDETTGTSSYDSPGQWYPAKSEEHDGRTFWVHKETSETSWEAPEDMAWEAIEYEEEG